MTVAPLGPVDYSSAIAPPLYQCGDCGAHGVKLWRDYQTFLNHQSLKCCDCAAKADERTWTITETPDGKPKALRDGESPHYAGDQIGWRVPAVPTEDGETYWGYTSVPAAGCAWFYRLPLRREVVA